MALKTPKEIVPLLHVRLGHFTVSDELIHRLSTANREIRTSSSLYLSDLDGFFRGTPKRKLGLVELVTPEQLDSFLALFGALEPSIQTSNSRILVLTRIVDPRLNQIRDRMPAHFNFETSRANVRDLHAKLLESVLTPPSVKPIAPAISADEVKRFRKVLAPLEKTFNAITDPQLVESYFLEGKNLKSKAILWTQNRKNIFNVSVQDYGAETQSLKIGFRSPLDTTAVQNEIKSQRHALFFFNMSLLRASLFTAFDPKAILFTGDSFTLPLKKMIFQIQRRNEFRYEYSLDTEVPRVLLEGIQCSLLNISAGGIKIKIAQSKIPETFAPKNGKLYRTQWILDSVAYDLKSEIRWIKPTDDGTAFLKMGLQFKEINELDRQSIRFYVFERNYEYLKRFVKTENPSPPS